MFFFVRRKKKIGNLENKKYWIWFSLIKDVGVRRRLKLLEIFKNPEKIYFLSKKELISIKGIGEQIASNIIRSKDQSLIQKHINYMKRNNIDIINIFDKEYPKILAEICDPPISLFIKGNKNILNNFNVAIIGCRECSNYGAKIAKNFAYNLVKYDINIVSGLAKGIDSYSHIGSIEGKGKTIAVLGNGLDTIYPKENYKLAEDILQNNGAIISEYPCGTKPNKINFPARNRIVSGMSKKIVVIEAKEKSGTLITVDFALEQGKDVYVVPGNIDSENSIGTNELIKQGAMITTTYKDILIE